MLQSPQKWVQGFDVGLKALLEAGETGQKIPKAAYARAQERLRIDLVNAQFDLRQANWGVVVLMAGDDRIGINEVVQLLHEWMDARYLDTRIAVEPTVEERQQPPFWRFWNSLPLSGGSACTWGLGVRADPRPAEQGAGPARFGHLPRSREAL